MSYVNPLAAGLPASGIREIVNLVLNEPAGTVARLEIGEPFSRTPQHIVDATVAALDGRTGYTQSSGMLELREAISERLARVHGMQVAPDRTVVTQGAVQGIAATFAAVLRPGDEVLVPDPAWPVYHSQALIVGARPVSYPLRAERGYLPDPEEVASLITPRTRVLVLNSPSNPTGSVADAALMERLVHAAVERGVLVVSDEVYDEIVFDGAHVGAAQFAPDAVVTAYSFSKTYSMTGWRVGYLVVPGWMTVAADRVQESQLSSISQLSQIGARAALLGPQDAVLANLAEYRRRRDLVLDLLTDAELVAHRPSGAFYLMMPLPGSVDSRRAALELVQRRVAVAPGTAFGTHETAFVRLSLASDEHTLREGIARIVEWARMTDLGRVPLAMREAGARS